MCTYPFPVASARSPRERAQRLLALASSYPDERWIVDALAREWGVSETEARFLCERTREAGGD